MNMIEIVARALLKERVSTTSEEWKRYRYEDSWKLFAKDARIAIAAMKEPTDGMLAAGVVHDDATYSTWCAMIDAALVDAE